MAKSALKVGMLIEHPLRPQWGPGKVVAVTDKRLYVYFRNDLQKKAKTLLTDLCEPNIPDAQSDAVLDNLPPATHNGLDWILPKNYEKILARAAVK